MLIVHSCNPSEPPACALRLSLLNYDTKIRNNWTDSKFIPLAWTLMLTCVNLWILSTGKMLIFLQNALKFCIFVLANKQLRMHLVFYHKINLCLFLIITIKTTNLLPLAAWSSLRATFLFSFHALPGKSLSTWCSRILICQASPSRSDAHFSPQRSAWSTST